MLEQVNEIKSTKPKSGSYFSSRTLSGSGFISSLLAVFSASCCVLPFLLLNLGLGGALVARLAWFGKYKDWFLGGSVLLILLALFFAFAGGRRPSRFVVIWLGLSIVLVGLAYILPSFEGDILLWLKAGNKAMNL